MKKKVDTRISFRPVPEAYTALEYIMNKEGYDRTTACEYSLITHYKTESFIEKQVVKLIAYNWEVCDDLGIPRIKLVRRMEKEINSKKPLTLELDQKSPSK